ncbi:MAG: hypothetical protein FJ028_03720 [Chloroflexi bacterium]|nr:hypothetical protein [Chloroflexota bacterium]
MTLLGLALRSHLAGFLATTLIAVLTAFANALAYGQLAGDTPLERALFARQMELVGRQLSYLLPLPSELETLSGFLQWRMFGITALVYGFWALLAACGAGRGDEERGLVEAWLATGITRLRWIVARVVAFLCAAALSIALMMAAALAGSMLVEETLSVRALALQGVALLAVTAFCFAWSLLVAQLATTRRSAAGIAGVALMTAFLVNSASRSGGMSDVAWLSPFWLYDRSATLLRAGTFDALAVGALAAATIVDLTLAVWAFASRDLGASLLRRVPRAGRAVMRPSGDPLLRLPVLAHIDQQRWWILGWMAGLAALAFFLTSLTRTMVDALVAIPSFRVYIERLGTAGYESFVAIIWGSTALLLLSLFAIFQVSSWVADDAEGRLEAVLTQPVSRARVALERVGTLLAGAALIVAAGALSAWATAARNDIPLSAERFASGSALMVTVPLAFGAIGAVLSGWRPRAAVPVLTVVAIASYFIQQFAPLFSWPAWAEGLSVYSLYGEPIAKGVEWEGITVLVALGLGGTGLGLALFQRRDVGR